MSARRHPSSPPTPDRARRGASPTRRWVFAALALLGLAAAFLVPRLVRADLRHVLATTYSVDASTLYANVPEQGPRYPGSLILLDAGGLALQPVGSGRWKIDASTQCALRVRDVTDVRTKSNAAAPVFNAALQSSSAAEIVLEVPDATVLEPGLLELSAALPAGEARERILAAGGEVAVVVRAFVGHVRLRLERKSSTRLEAWSALGDELKAAGAEASSDLDVRFESAHSGSDDLLVESKNASVFAFQVQPLAQVLKYAPGTPVAAAPAREFRGGSQEAVETLLRVGPQALPDLGSTAREIRDPGVARLLQVLAEDEPERRVSAAQILAQVPAPPGAATTPEVALASPSPRLRAWAVTRAAAQRSAGLPLLGRATSDADAGIRFLAVRALGELGVDARGAQPALEKAKLDADPVVRFQALDSLERIQASQTLDVKAFHDGLKSADPRTRQAAAHYLGRQRVLDLSASKDDQLRAGAIEALDKKWVAPKMEHP